MIPSPPPSSKESAGPGTPDRPEKAMSVKASLLSSALFFFLLLTIAAQTDGSDPTPTLWPERFHAVLYMNLTSNGRLQITDLWYDWPERRNLNIMQKQLGELLYDVEWDNGTSYYYTLGSGGSCLTRHFEVGIPRPNWLVGSTYLGLGHTDGFLCYVWEKVDFILYYEDVVTRRPVRWDFYDGITTHVMTFEEGATVEEAEWQAPAYCFSGEGRSLDKESAVRTTAVPGDFDLDRVARRFT